MRAREEAIRAREMDVEAQELAAAVLRASAGLTRESMYRGLTPVTPGTTVRPMSLLESLSFERTTGDTHAHGEKHKTVEVSLPESDVAFLEELKHRIRVPRNELFRAIIRRLRQEEAG